MVVATGAGSEIGAIQRSIQETDQLETRTPLQEKLDEFSESLSKIIGVICILVRIYLGLFRCYILLMVYICMFTLFCLWFVPCSLGVVDQYRSLQ